jgi:putative drug exporter of the RND superfamily
MLVNTFAGIGRRPKAVLLIAALFLLVGGAASMNVRHHLGVGGFYAAGEESTRADAAFDSGLPTGPHNLVVVAETSGTRGVDSPAAVSAGRALTEQLRHDKGISSVVSYWTTSDAALRSADGRTALVLARITGTEDERKTTLVRLFPRIHGQQGALSLRLGGQPAVEREVTDRSEKDLRRMELLATPVVSVVLLFVFGSVVASLLPLVIGLTAIVGTLVTLRLLTVVTDVSMYSLNIATALSLGLAIDYGLFIVTRYREELDAGSDVPAAVATTLATAGRTVLFSALTVALSLSSLLVFPLYYLRSFAYAGIAVVGFAALSAVVVLPAVLLVLGRRVDRWDVVRAFASRRGRNRGRHNALRRRLAAAAPSGGRLSRSGTGRWHRLATFVMRHPVPLVIGGVTILLVLGSPFLGVRYALPDESSLPRSSESHQVVDLLQTEFGSLSTDAMYVVSPERRLSRDQTSEYAAAVSRVTGVSTVTSSAGTFSHGVLVAPASTASGGFDGPRASWISVDLAGNPQGLQAEAAVTAVRSIAAPAPVLVGGVAAHLVDTRATLGRALPWAVTIVAVSTLVLLFLFTGSVLIPIKAVLLNLLSLSATFGAAVWIFQEGHLRWLLGDFQTNGAIELTTPILLFAVAFGLSMDYELFLLSRIKEEYQRLNNNTAAVAAGLEKTGRLVTYAALLFVIVMITFATSGLSVLKLVGVGLGLAVFMDATLVRAILVPAVMRLAGNANWWAPRVLRDLHQRIGLRDSAESGAHVVPDRQPAAPDPAPAYIVIPTPRSEPWIPRTSSTRRPPTASSARSTSSDWRSQWSSR